MAMSSDLSSIAGMNGSSQGQFTPPPGAFDAPGGIGGNQNVPNLFGGDPSGMGGYNAMYANPQQAGQPWMNTMMGGAYGMTGGGAPQAGGGGGVSPSDGLGSLAGGMGYLQNIAGGGGAGAPVSQLPAWQAMVNAQNYNIHQGSDSLAEQFNNGGGLFSTAYGGAQGLYQQQARLGQNAQLTQAQTQAMQQALQNQYGAGQQLSSQGYGGMNSLYQGGLNSAMLAAQLSAGAGTNMANLSAGAGTQQFNSQNQAAMLSPQLQQQLLGLGITGAGMQGSLYNQNLQSGMGLGTQQYGMDQNGLNAAYQNWYMSQPQNNPLLSMMYAGATGYPQLTQPTYNPGMMGSMMQGAGSILGGLGGMGLMLSDRRAKENITKVGKIKDATVYAYNFKGSPVRQLGFVAQQLVKRHPESVIRGDKDTPWMINLNELAKTLGVR